MYQAVAVTAWTGIGDHMNPYLVPTPFVISFSGGRTSAFMLAKVLDAYGGRLPAGGYVCFANTGREHEGTLEFVRDCADGFGCEIHWVERDFSAENTVRRVEFASASRNGEPFSGLIAKKKMLPNVWKRFCTSELKVTAIARYMNSLGVDGGTMVVGLRADEPRRVKRVDGDEREGFDYVTPMYHAGHTILDVRQYWNSQPWDLRLPFDSRSFGNCDMCFLKGRRHLDTVMRHEPERAEWWIEEENRAGQTWINGIRYEQMLVQVRIQPELFGGSDGYDEGDDHIIPCTCTD